MGVERTIGGVGGGGVKVVGTSGLVSPSAEMPGVVKDRDGVVIEVNPDYSMITRLATLKLEGPSGEVLPRVLAALAHSDV